MSGSQTAEKYKITTAEGWVAMSGEDRDNEKEWGTNDVVL